MHTWFSCTFQNDYYVNTFVRTDYIYVTYNTLWQNVMSYNNVLYFWFEIKLMKHSFTM